MLANVKLYWSITLPLLHSLPIVHKPIQYFIILDGVSHGELIPLHLPSFSAFMRPLRQYK